MGSFTPAFFARGPAQQLFRINFFFYVAELAQLFRVLSRVVTDTIYAGYGIFYLFLVLPFFWLAFRAIYTHQVRLARNAGRVLQTMTKAAAGTRAGWRGGRAVHTMNALLEDLPWLPCFDKLDVLVIRELLASSSSNYGSASQPSANAIRALAFSAHFAARMGAPEGTVPPSMYAWLEERGVSLDVNDLARLRGSLSQKGAVTPEIEQPDHCLPFEELRTLGWKLAPGGSCALISPVGILSVGVPIHGMWSTANSTPTHRPKIDLLSNLFFAEAIFYGLFEGANYMALLNQGANYMAFGVIAIIYSSSTALLLGVPFAAWVKRPRIEPQRLHT
jgi:hypothetical protein